MRRNSLEQSRQAGRFVSSLERDLHDDAALDEGLAESFPASDPVAISIDSRVVTSRELANSAAPTKQARQSSASAPLVELERVLALAGNMLQFHQLHYAISVIGASAPALSADQIFVKVSKDHETCEAQYDRRGLPVAFDMHDEILQRALDAITADASQTLVLNGPDRGYSVAESLDSHGFIVIHWDSRQSIRALESATQLVHAFAVLTRAFLVGMDDNAMREARLCRRETAMDQHARLASRQLRASEARTAKAQELAARDVLTGLQNRRGFFIKAEERFELAKKQELACAVIFADVDGLKTVNDRHGHEAGDELIRDAAAIFRQAFRAADVVARLGGDEFVAFTIDDTDPEIILGRLESLIQMFNSAEGRPYRLSLSTGVAACTPSTSAMLADYLQLADAEMYKRKRRKIG